eukprot:352927-Chlamydomonas_euryale.AAC.8
MQHLSAVPPRLWPPPHRRPQPQPLRSPVARAGQQQPKAVGQRRCRGMATAGEDGRTARLQRHSNSSQRREDTGGGRDMAIVAEHRTEAMVATLE